MTPLGSAEVRSTEPGLGFEEKEFRRNGFNRNQILTIGIADLKFRGQRLVRGSHYIWRRLAAINNSGGPMLLIVAEAKAGDK